MSDERATNGSGATDESTETPPADGGAIDESTGVPPADGGDPDPPSNPPPSDRAWTDEADESAETDADGAPIKDGDATQLESESDGEESGSVAGSLERDRPLEPGEIDPENALFVLIGALFVIGFLVLGIQGL